MKLSAHKHYSHFILKYFNLIILYFVNMFIFHNKYTFIFFICFPKIYASILYGIYNPYKKRHSIWYIIKEIP